MCLQPIERGTHPTATATSQMAAGWDPPTWTAGGPSAFYGSGLSGLLGSPSSSCTLNLSDYVDTSTQHTTGIGPTPSAAAGSAKQLHDAGHQHTDSARDDVTEHERDQS